MNQRSVITAEISTKWFRSRKVKITMIFSGIAPTAGFLLRMGFKY